MAKEMRKTKIPDWYEFTGIACPICDRTGGCIQHKNGEVVACIRIESKHPFSKDSSLPSYLHFLKGDKKRRKIKDSDADPYQKSEKKLDDASLHEIYQALLDSLELEDSHYEHLTSKERNLTDKQVRLREYRSFPKKPWNAVKVVQSKLGINDFTGVPGFYQAKGKHGSYWTISGMESILIPFRNHKNQITGFQYRLDNPPNEVKIKDRVQGLGARVIKQPNTVQVHFEGEVLFEKEMELNKTVTVYRNGASEGMGSTKEDILGWITLKKGNRYLWLSSTNKPKGTSSGDPAPVHVSVATDRLNQWNTGEILNTKKLWLSEGPLKTDIASERMDLLEPEEIATYGDVFMALPGVNAWRVSLPVMKEMGVEEINLCFDADVVSNVYVQKVLMDCIKRLKTDKYHVNMVIWNAKDGKGIDNLLNNNLVPQFKHLF